MYSARIKFKIEQINDKKCQMSYFEIYIKNINVAFFVAFFTISTFTFT